MPTLTLKYPEVKNYVAGKPEANVQEKMDVHSPLDGTVISTVPLSSASDLDKAVKAQDSINAFLRQDIEQSVSIGSSIQELLTLVKATA